MSTGFNGLGMHLGNLSRLSSAETRSISAENFDGSKGGAARPPKARARWPHASWARAGRFRPRINVRRLRNGDAGRHRRAGRHPAHLAHGSSDLGGGWCCASTGMARRRPRSRCRWATSSPMAGASAATSTRCRWRSTRPAASTATGRCPSASAPASRSRT